MKKRTLLFLPAALLALTLVCSVQAKAEGGPVLTKQPEDVIVAYPEGASFSVEAEDPEEIASYQWIMEDKEGTRFVLSGSSAKTDTLVIPSTQQSNDVLDFYCIVTGKDGSETVSERGRLDLNNRDVNKPVFYVCEYAVEPGETLDLSTVDIGDGHTLGSGTVAFDSNAKDLTISNLDLDNSYTMCDLIAGPNVGLDMEYYMNDQEEYNVAFVGENRIMNTYYDFDYNQGGIPFDFCFTGEGIKPVVNFVGDGTLTVTNGYNAVRVIGDLMIDVDVTIRQTRQLYADGICAENLMVAEGRKLDLQVYGTALYARKGDLFIDGAEILTEAHAPHISAGIATKNVIQAAGDIMIKDAKVDVTASAEPEVSGKVAGNSCICTPGQLSVYGSSITCRSTAGENEELYASDFIGITAESAVMEDSAVSVTIDSPYLYGAGGIFGIYTETDLSLLNSSLDVDVRASGSAYGVAPEGEFSVEDSNVSVHVANYPNYTEYGPGDSYGILCENAVFKLTGPKWQVRSTAENGMALGCNTHQIMDEPARYTEGYEAQNVCLRDGTLCLVPEENVISLGNVVRHGAQQDDYVYVETYYDSKDTSKPAQEAVFGCGQTFDDVADTDYYCDAVYWAVNRGITTGMDAAHFAPGGTCTRGQMVTFLWRAAGKPSPAASSTYFVDADTQAYYYDAVLWAVEQGITTGTGDTTFSPDASVTRGQAVTFLWRAAGKPAPAASENPFADVGETDYYYDAVLWAVENGVTTGTGATAFSPGDNCLRCQVVTFLYRACGSAEQA